MNELEISISEFLFIVLLLTISITIFVQCTFPGVLSLLGKSKKKVSTVCKILGVLWVISVLFNVYLILQRQEV